MNHLAEVSSARAPVNRELTEGGQRQPHETHKNYHNRSAQEVEFQREGHPEASTDEPLAVMEEEDHDTPDETLESVDDHQLLLETVQQRTSGRSNPSLIEEEIDGTLDLVFSLLSCRKGMGLSHDDYNRILYVVTNPNFKPENIKVRSAEQLEKYIADYQARAFGKEVIFIFCSLTFFGFLGLSEPKVSLGISFSVSPNY